MSWLVSALGIFSFSPMPDSNVPQHSAGFWITRKMLSLFTVGGRVGEVRKHSMRRFDYPARESEKRPPLFCWLRLWKYFVRWGAILTPGYDKIPGECWISSPLALSAPEASRFLHGPAFNQSPLLLGRFLICLCTGAGCHRSTLGFKSMTCAATILSGIEIVHIMCKGQARYIFAQVPSLAEQFEILAS